MEQAAANILDSHFRSRPGQAVLVVAGEEKRALGETLARGLRERGCHPELVVVRDFSDEWPEEVAEVFGVVAAENAPPAPEAAAPADGTPPLGLMVLCSMTMWLKLGLFRRVVCDLGGPMLDVARRPVFFDEAMPLESVLRVFSSDSEDDRRYLTALQGRLRDGAATRIVAPGGTDLSFVPRQWLTSGRELLTSPVEDTVQGRLSPTPPSSLGE